MDDAWSAFGQWRGAPLTAEVDVGPNGLEIALDGDGPAAQFINAILIEPSGQTAALDAVRARRAEWYRSHWPVVASGTRTTVIPLPAAGTRTLPARRITIAPGTGAWIRIAVAAHKTTRPMVELDAPEAGGFALPANVWAGQWRLIREGAADTVLRLTDDLLRADVEALPLGPACWRESEFSVLALAEAAA